MSIFDDPGEDCAPCKARTPIYGHPTRCSFHSGTFAPDGLLCRTFAILNDWTMRNGNFNETWNNDQSVQVFAAYGKFLIVGRYHSKPYRTESCVIIDEEKVNAAPTFAEVAPFLEGRD